MNNACAGVAPSCPRHCRKIAGSGLASRNCAEQNTRSSNSGNNGGQIAGRWSRSSRLLLVRIATLAWRAMRAASASIAASARIDARRAAMQSSSDTGVPSRRANSSTWPCASDALETGCGARWRLDLDDEVDGPHVDAELEDAGGDHAAERARLG